MNLPRDAAQSTAARPEILRRLWWLHPAWPFAGVVGVTILAAWWQDAHAYRLYGTPKYVQFSHVVTAFAAIAVFVLGCAMSHLLRTTPRNQPRSVDGMIVNCFYLFAALTVMGYAVWFGIGFKNGFSPRMAIQLLTEGNIDDVDSIRRDIFPTIPGITTCTQFGAATVLLGSWLFVRGERRRLYIPLAAVFGAAAIRCVLFSERFALIELLLPTVLVALRWRVLGRATSRLVRGALFAAPALGLIGLVLFFGFCEYFRSWSVYQNQFDSFAEFTVWRISGYYTTAHNNAAMALTTNHPRPLPYYTLRAFWEFPGVRTSSFSYEALTGIDMVKSHEAMLERHGTPELNNEGGLFQPALEFGAGGFLIFWFVYGFVSLKVYREYLAGTLAGIVLYPLVYISILETPLVLVLFYPRMLPSLTALLTVTWLASRVGRSSVPAWDASQTVSPVASS